MNHLPTLSRVSVSAGVLAACAAQISVACCTRPSRNSSSAIRHRPSGSQPTRPAGWLGTRPRDPAACADVLERAAFACRTDPVAAKAWVEAELLDELVDCYQALGRVDEADHRDARGPATPPTYIGPVTHPTICAGTFETDTSGGFWVA